VDGPAGQPREDVRSRAMGVSSVVIARAPIPALCCLGTTVSAIATKTGFVPDTVAQVCFSPEKIGGAYYSRRVFRPSVSPSERTYVLNSCPAQNVFI